ncbi:MAG: transporter ATP-binding protein [Frankiales bacterium]|nr:transporter ATP-binding protein [Frankiales bacterium]
MTDLANSGHQHTATVRTDIAVETTGLRTGYLGRPVVYDASFSAEQGKITALFGHNGAGKSSSLKAISGLLPMFAGTVKLFGEDVTASKISDRVRKGVVYLPQERAVFTGLTVRDNLQLGAALEHDKKVVAARRENVVDLFPRLGERLGQYAQTMSGGEQRMLAMGIALMAGAKILLLDEPSLGLSPQINLTLLEATRRLCQEQGVTVILVEQAIGAALAFVDHVYVMRSGAIVAEHNGDEARAREDWWRVF